MNSVRTFLAFRTAVVPAILCVVVVAFAASVLHAAEQLYTCSMHPQILKKEPGNCPICGMTLTPVRANSPAASTAERKLKYYKSTMIPGQISDKPGKDTMGMDMEPVFEGGEVGTAAIQIDPGTIQRMNLRTDTVSRGPVVRTVRAVGTVAFNERGLRDITTKYEGWIEKLHVNSSWATVKAGDPLFEVYSPEVYNAQLNYLVALKAEAATGGPLTRSSLERLKLFDLSPDFLADLARTGEAKRTYTFRSPANGVVIEKMAVEGQMMRAGERLFRLADLSTVWIEAQFYERDAGSVAVGQQAALRTTYGTEREFRGEIERIIPQIQPDTRTVAARFVIGNEDGFLRPGMFAEVGISVQIAPEGILVPDTAVLRSGERNTVFVATDGGRFEPRQVKLGARTDSNRYQVLSGVVDGERVVVSGQFMLDSESQLREAIEKMLGEEKAAPGAATEHQH